MNSVLEYLPSSEGWLPTWIFFVRLQCFNHWPINLTSPRSQLSRSVTAYKPTSRLVLRKRSTAARSLRFQLVCLPTRSAAHRPSHLSQLALLAPGPQSLPLSVCTPPTTSTLSLCTSWPSGHMSLPLHTSCPNGWSLDLQDGARVLLDPPLLLPPP